MDGSFGRRLGRWLVLGPPFLFLAMFFLAPFLMVLRISLSEKVTARPPFRPVFDPDGGLAGLVEALGQLNADNFRTLWDEPLYLDAFWGSLRLAALTTIILVVVAYPVAHAMARAPARWRPLLLVLAVLPFWTSFLIRVYAWIGILKPDGFLDRLLRGLGLIDAPLDILNTDVAVLIGLVYSYMPFMLLPIYAALERRDPTLLEAAQDLGCPPWKAFWLVTVPLSWPGVAAGAMLVFIPALGEFVIPDLLGGSDTLMIGRSLWTEFFNNRDWPLASAVAMVLLLVILGPVLLYRRLAERRLEAMS